MELARINRPDLDEQAQRRLDKYAAEVAAGAAVAAGMIAAEGLSAEALADKKKWLRAGATHDPGRSRRSRRDES